MQELPRAIALYPEDHACELHLGNGKAIRAQITEPDSHGNCCVILNAINAGHDLQFISSHNGQLQVRVAPAWQEDLADPDGSPR